MKTGEPVHTRVRQLRDKGAAQVDPARMAQLEALARRLADQPDAVRALLQERLELAMHALEHALEVRVAQAPIQPPARVPAGRARQLPQLPRPPDSTEMASVVRFRRSWANGRAQERIAAATARKPRNAGPLNSHMLVLQALDMMQALPGDYLRRFLTHIETLQWLETTQAQGSLAVKPKRKKPR
jgi:hypothetical protein